MRLQEGDTGQGKREWQQQPLRGSLALVRRRKERKSGTSFKLSEQRKIPEEKLSSVCGKLVLRFKES